MNSGLTLTTRMTPQGEEITMASSAQPVEHPEWRLADQRTAEEIRSQLAREQLVRLASRKGAAKPWWRVW